MTDTTPRPTSVYRYYDKSGLLLYVGITSRGTARQSEHNRDKEWWRFVARQSVEHFGTRDEAEKRERSLIGHFRPPFNRQHNPFHAEMRELYLAASASGALRRRPKSEVMAELGRVRHRLPLNVVKMSRERAILVAEPDHGDLVAALEVRRAVPLMAGKKIGGLVDLSMVGDRAMLVFDLRAIARPFVSAVAHIKADTREQRVWLHQVGVTA